MDCEVLLGILLVFLWMKPTDVVSNTVLQCPDTSVDAEIGKTVILRCLYVPQMNVNDMTVEWVVNDTDHHVHAQRGGKQKLDDQMKEYRGRTSLFDNKLPEGNCSLRLTVQMSDSGRYRCSVIGEEILSCFTYLSVHERVKIDSSGLINKPRDASSSGSGQTGGDGKTGNDTSSALTSVVIPIPIIIIIIIIIIVVIWKCRKSSKSYISQIITIDP
uniref:butyrophilin subfamily 2 member A1-like n=1 Tax=Epinephelus lanceolatus TaxID=310571 RepID=UPI001447B6E3|nr:butyrophilin subfamily 2 member A1-like [Epinephelus lanceolatus]